MASSRTVTLASGGSITLSLDVDALKLARDDRALLSGLLDRIDEYEVSQTYIAQLLAIASFPQPPLDHDGAGLIRRAKDSSLVDRYSQLEDGATNFDAVSNIDTKANIDRDLKPDNVMQPPPVAPMCEVQRELQRESAARVARGGAVFYDPNKPCRICGELGHDGRRHKNDPKPVAVATVSAEPVKVPVVVPLATPEELRAQALHSHDDVLAKQLVRARNIKDQAEQRRAELERPRVQLHAKPAGQRPPAPVDRAAAEPKLPTPRATFIVEDGVVR